MIYLPGLSCPEEDHFEKFLQRSYPNPGHALTCPEVIWVLLLQPFTQPQLLNPHFDLVAFWQVREWMASVLRSPEGGDQSDPHNLNLDEHQPIHNGEICESHHISHSRSSGINNLLPCSLCQEHALFCI